MASDHPTNETHLESRKIYLPGRICRRTMIFSPIQQDTSKGGKGAFFLPLKKHGTRPHAAVKQWHFTPRLKVRSLVARDLRRTPPASKESPKIRHLELNWQTEGDGHQKNPWVNSSRCHVLKSQPDCALSPSLLLIEHIVRGVSISERRRLKGQHPQRLSSFFLANVAENFRPAHINFCYLLSNQCGQRARLW